MVANERIILRKFHWMKKFSAFALVFFFVLFLPMVTQAQKVYQDVVYLKNGSIIHGVLIEQIPNQSVKIKTRDENVFVFRIEEIEKITREEVKGRINPASTIPDNENAKQSGYINITELNFNFNVGINSYYHSYGIRTVNGYLFNPYFSLGLGIGIDQYPYVAYIPVYADLRTYLFPKKIVTPFAAMDLGYSIAASRGDGGNVLVNPSFGLRYYAWKKVALNFSLGVQIDHLGYNRYYAIGANYFNFKMGVSF